MAIEPLKNPTLQNSILSKNPETKSSNIQTLQDSILNVQKKDDSEKAGNEKKEKDQVELSSEAVQFLEKALEKSVDKNTLSTNPNSPDRLAIEFRGLANNAQRRELTDKEVDRVNVIRESFKELGVTEDKDILKFAEKKLQEIQNTAPDLVQLVQNGDATGSQYRQLNEINKLLNNSNGFGSEQVEGALQVQSNNLVQKFNDIVEQNKDQKLSRDSLDNLERLQEQLSAIQGYRLNVRDTIGPDGIVI